MIRVIKMDGTPMMLNAYWIQSVEQTPDTLITLTTGFKLLVRDRVEDIVESVKHYKQEMLGEPPFSRKTERAES